jgi:peroxiredoxin
MEKNLASIVSGIVVSGVIATLTNNLGLGFWIGVATASIIYAIYWMIERVIIEFKSVRIGEAVPNISWTTIDGELIDLQKFRGDWVLLCYWCPCPRHRVDVLAVKSLYRDSSHGQLQVIVIDAPDKFKSDITLEKFANENYLISEFRLISNNQYSLDNNVFDLFDLDRGRPKYFLINPSGILHRARETAFSWDNQPYSGSRDDVSDLDEKRTLSNIENFMNDVYSSPSK